MCVCVCFLMKCFTEALVNVNTLQEQKRCVDGTLQREVKKVRKARNRRQEWNMMAFDKELRPDLRHGHTVHRGGSSEGSMSPENRWKIIHTLHLLLLKKNKDNLQEFSNI